MACTERELTGGWGVNAGTTASDVISGKSPLAKHTEFRSFATLNVACNSLSESAKAIGSLDMQSMPLTGVSPCIQQ